MSTPKGYTSQEKDDRLKAQFTTVTPIGLSKFALDVRDSGTVYIVGSDAVEASSTTSVINATAHAAKKGDRVRFTSGVLASIEADVWEVTTNTITLGQTLPSAPAAAVTFDILRPVSLTVGSDGTITTTVAPSPLIFTRNGVDQEVTEDTVTPANNRPLPVLLTGASGTVNITAGNLEVALDSGTDSVAAVQSGTWTVDIGTSVLPTGAATEATLASIDSKITAVNTGAVTVSSSALPTGAATEATLASIDGNITACDTGNVTIASSALPTGAATEATLSALNGKVTAVDTGNVTVSSSALPAGAATEATLASIDSALAGTIAVSGTFYQATQPVSAASLPLPTGAATEATLASIDGNIVACDTGSVTISAALPAGSNNIGDVDVLSLPAIPAGSNLIGSVDVNLDVIDLLDTNPVLDTSGTNIPASASNPLQVVATLAANVKKIRVNDTTGKFIGVYTGAALSEVLQAVIGPGLDGDIEVKMSSGERVSLRHMSNSVISSGELLIQFVG